MSDDEEDSWRRNDVIRNDSKIPQNFQHHKIPIRDEKGPRRQDEGGRMTDHTFRRGVSEDGKSYDGWREGQPFRRHNGRGGGGGARGGGGGAGGGGGVVSKRPNLPSKNRFNGEGGGGAMNRHDQRFRKRGRSLTQVPEMLHGQGIPEIATVGKVGRRGGRYDVGREIEIGQHRSPNAGAVRQNSNGGDDIAGRGNYFHGNNIGRGGSGGINQSQQSQLTWNQPRNNEYGSRLPPMTSNLQNQRQPSSHHGDTSKPRPDTIQPFRVPTPHNPGNTAILSIPPPPPPPPPPRKPISNHNHSGSRSGPSSSSLAQDAKHAPTTNAPTSNKNRAVPPLLSPATSTTTIPQSSSPPRVIVLSGVPSYVPWREINRYFSMEWNVKVQYVHMEPETPSATSTTNNSASNTPMDKETNTQPKQQRMERAYIKLSTHEDAMTIANYEWGSWDPPILGEDTIRVVGLHHTNDIGKNSRRDSTTISKFSSSRNAQPQHERRQKDDGAEDKDMTKLSNSEKINEEVVRGTTEKEEQRDIAQDNEEREYAEEQKRREEQWTALQEQKRNKRLEERKKLEEKKRELEQKKELISKQEENLQKSLVLHKKMLELMKNAAGKTKKMKEILSNQKKVNELKKEMLTILSALEDVKKEEKMRVLGGYGRKMNRNSLPGGSGTPAKRSFRLDKRTTILRVDGLPEDLPLEEVKEHFESFGPIASASWLNHNDETQEKVILLLNCGNRAVAERVRVEGSKFKELPLTFAWHQEQSLPSFGEVAHNGEDEPTSPVEEAEESAVSGNLEEDKTDYWNDDDDMMVDYDYDEEEDA